MRLQNSVFLLLLSSCVLFAAAGAAAISECGPEDSKCGDGACLPKKSLCDGVKDCPRGEDERYCNGGYTDTTTREYCDSTEYRCSDGSCIPLNWVCDGYRDCYYGDDEEYCYYSTETSRASYPWTTTDYPWTTRDPYTWPTTEEWSTRDPYPWPTTGYPWTTRDPYPYTTAEPLHKCENPFQIIGNKCVMIEPLVEGTWYESRYFCQQLDGDLVVLDSLESYSELVRFINEAKLTTRDYWVGASDEGHEGEWLWVNWVKVMNGTPLWALYGSGSSYVQEPRSSYGSTQDCGYLDMTRFYYMDDEDCTKKKAVICEKEHHLSGEHYEEDETYSGKIIDFLKSSEDEQESSEKDRGSKDSGESSMNVGGMDHHAKAKDTKSHRSGHEKPAVEESAVQEPAVQEPTVEVDGVKGEHEDRTSEKKPSPKTLEKFKEKLKPKASQGNVGNTNKRSKKQKNAEALHTENIEKVIEKLKAKAYQGRFGNMNLVRP